VRIRIWSLTRNGRAMGFVLLGRTKKRIMPKHLR
jgi:hypothetical protein